MRRGKMGILSDVREAWFDMAAKSDHVKELIAATVKASNPDKVRGSNVKSSTVEAAVIAFEEADKEFTEAIERYHVIQKEAEAMIKELGKEEGAMAFNTLELDTLLWLARCPWCSAEEVAEVFNISTRYYYIVKDRAVNKFIMYQNAKQNAKTPFLHRFEVSFP